jgi:hypothetical protein
VTPNARQVWESNSAATQKRTLRDLQLAKRHKVASLHERILPAPSAYRRVSLLRLDAPLNRNLNRGSGEFDNYDRLGITVLTRDRDL